MEKVPIRLGRLRTSVRDDAPTAAVDIRVHSSVNDASAPDAPVQLRAASAGRVCRVCTTHESRYTCPRCNLPYCSVDCYRSHGQTCTEQFYQEHVTNEMAFGERATAAVDPKAERQRMTMELLARTKQFHNETDRAFEDGSGLGALVASEDSQVELNPERLAQLALLDDTELSLESLTLEERERFLADVAGGRMSKYVMPWDPWWQMSAVEYEKQTTTRRRKLIIEVIDDSGDEEGSDGELNSDDEEEEKGEHSAPIESARFPATLFTSEMKRSIPPAMEALVCGAVSPCLPFHLVEILAAYAFTMRTFNGDWRQDPEDAALTSLHGSDVLRVDGRFSTLEQVVIKCLELRDASGALQSATNRLVLSDAAQILQSRVFVLDALTDFAQLVHDAAEEITRTRLNVEQPGKKKTGSKGDCAAVRTLRVVEKKLEFYCAWQFYRDDHSNTQLADTVRANLDRIYSGHGV